VVSIFVKVKFSKCPQPNAVIPIYTHTPNVDHSKEGMLLIPELPQTQEARKAKREMIWKSTEKEGRHSAQRETRMA
jgi:hypothetical protein